MDERLALMNSEGSSRIDILFCDRPDGLRPLLGDRATTSHIPFRRLDPNETASACITPSLTDSQRTYSTVSSAGTRAKSDTWSRGCVTVTTDASSVVPPHPEAVQLALPGQEVDVLLGAGYDTQDDPDPVDLGYELPCEFGFINCRDIFHPSQWEHWIHHTLSHFSNVSAPPGTICIYCDIRFNANEQVDAAETWRQRQEHIQQHLVDGASPDSARPDFALLKHMHANKLMTLADYKYLTKYNERPKCSGLVPDNWEPPEKILKNERDLQERFDISKQERLRRKEKRKHQGRGQATL